MVQPSAINSATLYLYLVPVQRTRWRTGQDFSFNVENAPVTRAEEPLGLIVPVDGTAYMSTVNVEQDELAIFLFNHIYGLLNWLLWPVLGRKGRYRHQLWLI